MTPEELKLARLWAMHLRVERDLLQAALRRLDGRAYLDALAAKYEAAQRELNESMFGKGSR